MLILTLLVSAGIGIYYRFTGGKQRTNKEYFLADGGVSIVPVSFSLVASFMSAISLMGLSTEMYSFGTLFLVINVAYIYGTAVSAYLYLPVFFKMQATSAYEVISNEYQYSGLNSTITIEPPPLPNFLHQVLGKTIRCRNACLCLTSLFLANDLIHGHCSLRTRTHIGGDNRHIEDKFDFNYW